MKGRACELCNQEASLYCASDSAFLCCNCDARVHEANFLVARHIREVLCCKCKCFAGSQISGGSTPPVKRTCRSCSPENPSDDDNDSLSSSSSVCVSSTESCATAPKKIRFEDRSKMERIASCSSVTDASGENCDTPAEVTSAKLIERKSSRRNVRSCAPTSVYALAEELFVNWSRKFGVNNNSVASLASHAFGFCLRKLTGLPFRFRVAVATSFWFGLRICGDRSRATFQNLRRLEAISGVTAKLILAAEAKLARVLRRRRARRELEEGWAEC